jgi:hypothetical protein
VRLRSDGGEDRFGLPSELLTERRVALAEGYRWSPKDGCERTISTSKAADERTKLDAIRRPIAGLDLRQLEQLVHQHLETLVPGGSMRAFVRDAQLVIEVGGAIEAGLPTRLTIASVPSSGATGWRTCHGRKSTFERKGYASGEQPSSMRRHWPWNNLAESSRLYSRAIARFCVSVNWAR